MILVTGATGHLGNVILRELVKRNVAVRAFVLTGDDISHIKDLPIEIVYGNILDIVTLDEAMNNVTGVIHTAALVSIGNTFKTKDIFNVNVYGLSNVLESAKRHEVKQFVHVSSIHAFNEIKGEVLITEKTSTDPNKHRIPYAKSKALALAEISKYRDLGLNINVLFPTGIIGPSDYMKKNNALLPIRLFLKTESKRHFYFNAGYDFVDVRDVAVIASKLLLEHRGNHDFILSGEYISLKEIYEVIAKYKHKAIKLVKVPNFFLVIGIHIYFFFCKLFRKKAPITPQAFKILTSKQRISSKKLRTSLKFTPRSVSASLIDSVKFIEINDKKR
ncbi:MAG TPA: NAD-dependent epimerase/dehydratase family protein [Acholeplasma sp.]|nr:NAD-dependent epimerase/dehydratase family protein [Acholeplasma sp.]